MPRVIARDEGIITLEEWLEVIVRLDGIRQTSRPANRPPSGDAEVFDSRYAEWVPGFTWREGTVEVIDGPAADRAAEAAARALQAAITSD